MNLININDLYTILRQWAIKGKPQTYLNLSNEYYALTGDKFEPHGSWDGPLGLLNNRLAAIGAPAISALVILKERNEPGGGFWNCAPNVPPRPRNEDDRLAEWNRIMNEVIAYNWPENLP